MKNRHTLSVIAVFLFVGVFAGVSSCQTCNSARALLTDAQSTVASIQSRLAGLEGRIADLCDPDPTLVSDECMAARERLARLQLSLDRAANVLEGALSAVCALCNEDSTGIAGVADVDGVASACEDAAIVSGRDGTDQHIDLRLLRMRLADVKEKVAELDQR